MTKLEEEIAKSLPFAHSIEGSEFTEVPDEYMAQVAKAAAEVAKNYIVKAYSRNENEWMYEHEFRAHKAIRDKWLKENGIIE